MSEKAPITFVMSYDKNFLTLGKACEEQMVRYCQRHGYKFRSMIPTAPGKLHPSWNKIGLLRDEIETTESDWVIWVDADTVIVDPETSFHDILAPIKTPAWFSSVDDNICAGIFGLRPNDWSKKFLDTIWSLGQMREEVAALYQSRWEQGTIKMLASHFSWVSDNYCLIGEEIIQNPWSIYCQDAFMCHFWMGPTRTQERAVDWINRAQKKYSLDLFGEIQLPRIGNP
jgi:hypothetical protein